MFSMHMVRLAASWFSEIGLMIDLSWAVICAMYIALYGTSDAGEVNIFRIKSSMASRRSKLPFFRYSDGCLKMTAHLRDVGQLSKAAYSIPLLTSCRSQE